MKIQRLNGGDDLSGAIALLQRFFVEEGFETPADVIAARTAALAALDTCLLIVAERDGQTIGVATVSSEFGIELGWWAEMGDLYVVPSGRWQGVAKALVEAAEDWMKERGIAGYQVTVTPVGQDHHGLMEYYRKQGFDSEGRLLLFKQL